MLSSRKRKASPEKSQENSKLRKLKVSNKIFRSPGSPKTNCVAKTKVSNLLPEGYEFIILTASTKPEEDVEGSEAVFGCVRLPIITREDALIWLKKFERKTTTSYRPQKTWKNDPKTGLSKRKFFCNHRTNGLYSCKACIIFTIKDEREIQANPDYYLRDYPSQVIIQFCHNHKIDSETYLKSLRPSTELRVIFGSYFADGHSPFSALICHKGDLHSSYGSEFYNVVSNGSICPSYNWCYREFEKLFMQKFVEPNEDELYEKLNDAVNQYNTKCQSECAILTNNPVFILSLCTPFMKSVFRSGFAEDLITVRSFCTPKTMPKRQKLVLFLCHTPIGSLPFGIVFTLAEDSMAVCRGIKNLLKMLGALFYSPKTIITDENSLISKSLKKNFPKSQIIFNEFQMLQSIWRVIRLVCQEDNEELQAIYNLFLLTLNSDSEEAFKENFKSLQIYTERYPKLTNFLKYFEFRSKSYVLYARPKVEFNTDVLNYTDSGTIILQDVSVKYGNFFNILQLFDFLIKTYVKHYERKLMKIVEGDLKGFFKTNFFVPLSKVDDFTCEKVTDTEFLVRVNDVKFFVNAELDTCTCQVGVYGGSCVHQYIVEKNLGLVPECYTPLGEDMLDIFKSILSYKDVKHKGLGIGLESFTESEIGNLMSSAGSSECSTISDTDNLGPIDEIYMAPSEIADSFTDEDMTPLELSELEDSNDDNDELSNDSSQYNRESGELEPFESSVSLAKQQNILVKAQTSEENHTFAGADELPQPDKEYTGNIITYDYNDTKSHNEVDVISIENLATNIGGYTIADSTVDTEINTPVVYTYATENEGHIQIYEEVMTENDKKTAEIAEFLTNLPDTNNLNYSNINSGDPIVSSTDSQPVKEASEVLGQFEGQIAPAEGQIASEGVVVMKNDEFFTQYKVMENGVLSIITDPEDEYGNQINTFQAATEQSFMGDSYEENNFVMMSPTDLFDNRENIEICNEEADKVDPKINVLSSVVIKPPADSSGNKEISIPQSPLNLSTVKHRTLRNVKEDSRSRTSESIITSTTNVMFGQNVLERESQEDNASSNSYEKNDDSDELEYEQDFNECQEKDWISELSPDKISDADIAGIPDDMNLTECDPDQLAEETFADVIEIDSDDLDELASQDYDPSLVVISNEKPVTPEKSPSKVAPAQFKRQSKEQLLVKSKPATAKAVPLREFLSKQSPKKVSRISEITADKKANIPKTQAKKRENEFLEGQLTTAFSQLTDLANKNNFKGSVEKFLGRFKELGSDENLRWALESFGTDTASSKGERQSKIKDNSNAKGSSSTPSPKLKDRGKMQTVFKQESDTTSKDTEEYGETEKKIRSDIEDWAFVFSDSDESLFTDSEDLSSTEFEHYSDCRTSCSDFHSELEGIVDLSDYEPFELQLSKTTGSANNIESPTSISSTAKPIKNIDKSKSVLQGLKTSRKLHPNGSKDTKKLHQYLNEDSSDLSDGIVQNRGRGRPATKAVKRKPIRRRFRNMDADTELSDETDAEDESIMSVSRMFKKSDTKEERKGTKLNLVAAGDKFKLNNEVSMSFIHPAMTQKACNNGETQESSTSKMFYRSSKTGRPPKKSVMTKDAKELETILMGVANVDNQDHKEEANETSILENEELSFLFNDPRFEAVIEEPEDFDSKGAIKEEESPKIVELPSVFYLVPPNVKSSTLSLANRKNTMSFVPTSHKESGLSTKYRPILPKPSISEGKLILPCVQMESYLTKHNEMYDECITVKVPEGKAKQLSESRRHKTKSVKHYLSKELAQIKQVSEKFRNDDSGSRRNRPTEETTVSKKLEQNDRNRTLSDGEFEEKSHVKPQANDNETKAEFSKGDLDVGSEKLEVNDQPVVIKRKRGRPPGKSKAKIASQGLNYKGTPNRMISKKSISSSTLKLYRSSLDFENSIEASVFPKDSDREKELPLVTSTPARRVGYEEAFRRFLKSSSEETPGYEVESGWDSNSGFPRKARPVSENSINTELGVIEYVQEPASDSDDSEIQMNKVRQRSSSVKRRLMPSSPDFEAEKVKYLEPVTPIAPKRRRGRPRRKIIEENVQSISKPRELELIVLLERNIDIELMCQSLRLKLPRLSRSMIGRRKGYKELLEGAKRLKDFD